MIKLSSSSSINQRKRHSLGEYSFKAEGLEEMKTLQCGVGDFLDLASKRHLTEFSSVVEL